MNKHKVLDLFCGCGGLSEGFRLAGYDIVMGIDINAPAIETYNFNFGQGRGICCDLLNYDESQIVHSKAMEEKVDVIIGGPPCQGFSSANRWNDTTTDVRNKLFFEYVKFVDLLKPKAIVIENVRQILKSEFSFASNVNCYSYIMQILCDFNLCRKSNSNYIIKDIDSVKKF